MLRRRLRCPRAWSPIAAIAAQLLLPGITAASTGGGDFPAFRMLSAVL